ncbi:MAG TPA: hypothetical protein VFP48_01035, partial [Steroidobacteraceae bacterium]|nr:hypothetical protein [Steroidobacteraceae bacterium]
MFTSLSPATLRAEPATDDWQWNAKIYLWLPSIGGESALPPNDGGPAIEVNADSFLDSLNSIFMGALEASTGPWGLAADVVYLDLDASRQATRAFGIGDIEIPSTVDADLKFGLTGWLVTLNGSYAIVQQERVSTSVLAGVRMLDLQDDLHYTFNGDISSLPVVERTGSAQARQTQWDAIVGLKGRALLGTEARWYVPYHLDVGAGESDYTLQAMLGLGYSFGRVDVLGVWRY